MKPHDVRYVYLQLRLAIVIRKHFKRQGNRIVQDYYKQRNSILWNEDLADRTRGKRVVTYSGLFP